MNNELVRDEAKRTIKNSAGRPGLNRLYTKYYRLTTNWPSTSVENPLQINSFMQNKANLPNAQMNVNKVLTRDYENIANFKLGENKANTKPNKANFRKAKMNVNFYSTKDYENISNRSLAENKPNTNPIQTQSNPTCSELVEPISKAKNAALHLRAVECRAEKNMFFNRFNGKYAVQYRLYDLVLCYKEAL